MPYLKKEFTDRIYERVNTDGELLLEVIREAAGEPRKHERSETTFVCPHCHSGALVVNTKKMVRNMASTRLLWKQVVWDMAHREIVSKELLRKETRL